MSESMAGGDTKPDIWEGRRKDNLRLAVLFGGIAVAVFLIALWKLRPF